VAANLFSTNQLEYVKVLARAVKNREMNKGTGVLLMHGYRRLQGQINQMTDVFLPNSESEMKRVIRDFPECAGRRYVVVPNAVDIELFDQERVTLLPEFQRYEGAVLCVARFEGRKCQLDLVRAMRDLPWPLVLAGQPSPNHMQYYEQVKSEAGANAHLLGQLPHDKLPALYKAARVHCLVSWMETTGLSSLEAAVMGCNLVITDKGDTRDYFGDHAFYCEPGSVESIRQAIVRAYEAPPPTALVELIRREFNWDATAARTIEGYELALRH
jgi:glycosyltransferase involved in cell wall biosynthesis